MLKRGAMLLAPPPTSPRVLSTVGTSSQTARCSRSREPSIRQDNPTYDRVKPQEDTRSRRNHRVGSERLFAAYEEQDKMFEIRIEGLDEVKRGLERLPREIERELDREFGSAQIEGQSAVRVTSASSEHDVQRRASSAIDRAIRRLGFGRR